MRFYLSLGSKLHGKVPEKLFPFLPRGHKIVGQVMLLRLKPQLLRYRKAIGKAALELRPYLHAVFLVKEIVEIERKPKLELLAAKPGKHPAPLSQTIHNEMGCQFLLDLKQVMWAAGNKGERGRLVKTVKPGETVVDMFAGIGYWSIPIAKCTRVKKVYAIDINPVAVDFMRKNAIMNRVEGKIEILEGDCRRFAPLLEGVADRVIVGWLYDTEKYLPAALKIAKKGAVVHFHRAVSIGKIDSVAKNILKASKKLGYSVKIRSFRTVKPYGPSMEHVVWELKKN